jgi:hypothetical protein
VRLPSKSPRANAKAALIWLVENAKRLAARFKTGLRSGVTPGLHRRRVYLIVVLVGGEAPTLSPVNFAKAGLPSALQLQYNLNFRNGTMY